VPTDYATFLSNKQQVGGQHGFEPVFLPDCLFPFQRHLSEWEIRKGRCATFAACGLGKTLLELVKAQNIVQYTNGRVLILTPIAVAQQFATEGQKFGIEVKLSRDGKVGGSGIYISNYERLHLFSPNDFTGLLGDESGCLKDFDGVRKAEVTEFMRTLPYRSLYSATAAPNDFDELGTHSEALGELGYQDMVSKFFKQVTQKDLLGWGRTKYKLRAYAQTMFWQWVCSWARACRKPSDLGFSDEGFDLPPLDIQEHNVTPRTLALGVLFDSGARTLQEQQAEQRRTLTERCEKVAELANAVKHPVVCWCNLNDEGDLLEKLIPDAVQISGADSDDEKEEKLLAFVRGEARSMISKSKLTGYGLNWQHCYHHIYFPSHSFSDWHQSVRRSWRFGQTHEVRVDIVTTDGNAGVLANLKRKQEQAEEMFTKLVQYMNDSLRIDRSQYGKVKELIPSWLKPQ